MGRDCADEQYRQVQILFEKHRSAAWFLEKYDPTEKYSDLRARVRKQGWQGALDQFLEDLETGKFDAIFETSRSAGGDVKTESPNGDSQRPIKTEVPESSKDEKPIKVEEDEEKTYDDPEWVNVTGKDDDEVIIPHKGHQVMIKTIPPDIGRLRLEPVCVTGPCFQGLFFVFVFVF